MLEKLKIFKKKPEQFRMRVSFDLDEVLFVSQRTHKVEPALPFPLNKIYIERLRFGTPKLINSLQQMGYDVWVYTSSFRTQKYIKHLFMFYGVKFNGIVNGQRHLKEVQGQRREILPQKVPPRYNISLHIDDETVIDNGYATLYDYSFTVSYVGASSVTIGVEQEYSSFYDIHHVKESSPAHVYVKDLSRGNMVWIDVSVTNEYGEDKRTIEIPVQSPDAIGKAPATEADHIDVYTMSGTLLGHVKSLSELSAYRATTLLLRYIDKDGHQLQIRKILTR